MYAQKGGKAPTPGPMPNRSDSSTPKHQQEMVEEVTL